MRSYVVAAAFCVLLGFAARSVFAAKPAISQKAEPYQFHVAGVFPDYCHRYQRSLHTVAYNEFSIDDFVTVTAWATCSNGQTLELHNT